MNEGYFSEGKCINKKMGLFSHLFHPFFVSKLYPEKPSYRQKFKKG